jgi:N-glycosylase/DNA lyase
MPPGVEASLFKIKLPELDIRKIADSGQCFRLTEIEPDFWCLIALGKCLMIRELACREYEFDCTKSEFRQIWNDYFDIQSDYSVWRKSVPWNDLFLTRAVEFGDGIRILRQDPWEMLVTFIISQRKNIPAIKRCVEALCRRFGQEIGGTGLYAFPSANVLAGLEESDYCECALGYRLPYIRAAAKIVSDGELDLAALAQMSPEDLPDSALLSLLLQVPGVGAKVAGCVMLFGFHRLGAFPVDVWIEKVIREYYSGNFPLELYSGFAGVIQQYIFYYARKGEKHE